MPTRSGPTVMAIAPAPRWRWRANWWPREPSARVAGGRVADRGWDGAWGTELQARGLAPGAAPDTWNLTHPERVEAVARAYVQAGSQVILTNTFRANAVAMEGGLEAINRAGVEISKRAAAGRALVFASIGPTGKMLMAGEIGGELAHAAFAAQAMALAAAGADALLVETMSDIEEARLAVAAAKSTGLPVIVSFAFDSGKSKDRTMMGATPEAVAAAMVEAGADAVGSNCGVGGSMPRSFAGACTRRAISRYGSSRTRACPSWRKRRKGPPFGMKCRRSASLRTTRLCARPTPRFWAAVAVLRRTSFAPSSKPKPTPEPAPDAFQID